MGKNPFGEPGSIALGAEVWMKFRRNAYIISHLKMFIIIIVSSVRLLIKNILAIIISIQELSSMSVVQRTSK